MLVVVLVVLPHRTFFYPLLFVSYLTLPLAIARFILTDLHQFCASSPAHCRVICDTFILTFLNISLYSDCYGFERVLGLPFFTLHSCPTFWHIGGLDEGRNTTTRIFLYF